MPLTSQYLIEPETLAEKLNDPNLLVIDLCSDQQYRSAHIPGAVHVSPAELMDGTPPSAGKLPGVDRLNALFSRLGLTPEKQVVVYDDEGGGWAGRMAWTLDIIGHHNWVYLNGGLIAWSRENYPISNAPADTTPVEFEASLSSDPIAHLEDVMRSLGNDSTKIWDARSREEFEGTRVVSRRGGHIPGAIHCEWTTLMDPARHYRIREDAAAYLSGLGLSADNKIITHCQSHHRSGFTYLVARVLAYPAIKGYHGSWSEWGNREDTPVETGNG